MTDSSTGPLDLNVDRLLEYLIMRNKVIKDWSNVLRALQKQVQVAAMLLPQVVQSNLGVDSRQMTYWDCVASIPALEKYYTEKGIQVKNVLGFWTNDVIKRFNALVRAYEADGLHIAESARAIQHSVQFEIPAAQKTIQTNDRQVADITSRIGDHQNAARTFRGKFAKACADMGVTTTAGALPLAQAEAQLKKDVILASKQGVDALLDEAEKALRSSDVVAGYELYKAFALVTSAAAKVGGNIKTSGSGKGLGGGASGKVDDVVDGIMSSYTSFINNQVRNRVESAKQGSEKGNSGMGVSGEGSSSSTTTIASSHNADTKTHEIEWEITVNGGSESSSSSSSSSAASSSSGNDDDSFGGGIDWTALMSVDNGNSSNNSDQVLNIDWDVTVEDDENNSTTSSKSEKKINAEEANSLLSSSSTSSSSSSSSSSTDSNDMLVNMATRQSLTCDLLELEAFLVQRLEVMATENMNVAQSLLRIHVASLTTTSNTDESGEGKRGEESGSITNAKKILNGETPEVVTMYLDAVRNALVQLRQPRLVHMLSVQQSPSAADRTANTLLQHLATAHKMDNKATDASARVKALKASTEKEQATIASINKKVTTTRKNLEKALKKILDRPVNILA